MDTPQPSPPPAPDPAPTPAPPPPGPGGPTQPGATALDHGDGKIVLSAIEIRPRCTGCGRPIEQGEMAHGRALDPRVHCSACGPLPAGGWLERALERALWRLRGRSIGVRSIPAG